MQFDLRPPDLHHTQRAEDDIRLEAMYERRVDRHRGLARAHVGTDHRAAFSAGVEGADKPHSIFLVPPGSCASTRNDQAGRGWNLQCAHARAPQSARAFGIENLDSLGRCDARMLPERRFQPVEEHLGGNQALGVRLDLVVQEGDVAAVMLSFRPCRRDIAGSPAPSRKVIALSGSRLPNLMANRSCNACPLRVARIFFIRPETMLRIWEMARS